MKNYEIIQKSTAISRMETGSKIILITENLSGHRIQWLKILASRLKFEGIGFIVCTLSDEKNKYQYEYIEHYVEICDDFDSKNDLLTFLKPYSKVHKIVSWDGDNWLIPLIRHKLNCRILIMRPYVDISNLRTFLRTTIKLVTCNIFNHKNKFEIAYLRIPMDRKKLSRIYTVDDELDIEFNSKNLNLDPNLKFERESYIIVLPGFITSRKNPFFAISAIEMALKSAPYPIEFKILGSLDNRLNIESEIIHRNWIKLENSIINRYEFLEQIANADLVILPYSNRASSAIALESMSLGTKVLMAQSRSWQKLQKANPNLFILAPLQIEKFSEKIIESLSKDFQTGVDNVFIFETRQKALSFLIHGRT